MSDRVGCLLFFQAKYDSAPYETAYPGTVASAKNAVGFSDETAVLFAGSYHTHTDNTHKAAFVGQDTAEGTGTATWVYVAYTLTDDPAGESACKGVGAEISHINGGALSQAAAILEDLQDGYTTYDQEAIDRAALTLTAAAPCSHVPGEPVETVITEPTCIAAGKKWLSSGFSVLILFEQGLHWKRSRKRRKEEIRTRPPLGRIGSDFLSLVRLTGVEPK